MRIRHIVLNCLSTSIVILSLPAALPCWGAQSLHGNLPKASTLAWSTYFNGIGNGEDTAGPGKVDGSGNFFVTAKSWDGTNSVTVALKYSPAGSLLWERHLGSPWGAVLPRAACLDGSGNFIVTGQSTASDGRRDIFIWKLSASGTSLWTNQLQVTDSPSQDDEANGIGVDSTGNVYVGGSGEHVYACDILVAKYNAAGLLLWTARNKVSPYNRNALRGMAVDPTSGAVYCLAESVAQSVFGYTTNDYAFIKISSGGTTEWVRESRSGRPDDGAGSTVMLSQDAGIYFTGYADFRLALWKFDSSGTLVWSATYPANLWMYGPHSAAVDLFGNVTICSANLVAHFTRTGALEWSARLLGQDRIGPTALVSIDETQSAYLRGVVNNSQVHNMLLTRFESNGSRQWSELNSVADTTNNLPAAFVVTNGAAYAADSAMGPSATVDAAITKHTVPGALGPTIASMPPSGFVVEGSNITLTVGASGSDLRYQWFADGKLVCGGTNASYSLQATATNPTSFSVEVRDSAGMTSVSPETLLGICVRPPDQHILEGGNARFAPAFFGLVPLGFRWQFEGTTLSTNAELSLTNLSQSHSGTYTLALEDGFGRVFTTTCRLTVSAQEEARWTQYFTNGGVTALALDHIGNVVILSEPNLISCDLVVCATNGALKTVVSEDRIQTPYNPYTYQHLRTDAHGNIYLHGPYYNRNFRTEKYEPVAARLSWASIDYAGYYPNGTALATDNDGNAFTFGDATASRYFPASYIWASRVNKTGATFLFGVSRSGYDSLTARDVTLLPSSDLGLLWNWTAYPMAPTNYLALAPSNIVVRVSRDGVLRWISILAVPGEKNTLTVLKSDAVGNMFASGSAGVPDSCVTAKWDTNGVLQWVRRYYGANLPSQYADASTYAAAVDSAGNFLVTTSVSTLKYSSDGILLWSSPWRGRFLKLDEHDNAYVLGRLTGDVAESIAKVTTNGTVAWRFGTPDESLTSFDVEREDVVYAAANLPETDPFAHTFALHRVVGPSTPAIAIGDIPATIQAEPGTSVSLTIPVTPAGAYDYQWFRDGLPIDGGTNATLQLTNFQPSQAGGYSLRVSSSAASVTSRDIWVTPPLRISSPEYRDQAVRFRFNTDQRYTYEVQRSMNLTQWESATNIYLTNGTISYSDTTTNGAAQYRVFIRR